MQIAMANAKIAVLIAIVLALLLQVSCAAARLQGKTADGDRPTPAVMTVNGFEEGQDGGDPSECDGKFHSNNDLIVALSSQWYAGGKRCHKKIRITSLDNKRSVEAQVVDECDSHRGCRTNIVDSSPAVWKKLGLDTDVGEVRITWSDV